MSDTEVTPEVTRPVDERHTHAFEFRGSGGEYFRIWIVNLLLSIVTLGIYSAWATVRNRRYLYRSTYVMGSAFDYHATGGQVLRGRLIAVAALALYLLAGYVMPGAGLIVLLAVFVALPWIVVQARMFTSRNTSWRDVRFGFDRNYGEAYAIYFGLPLAIPFTLGLIIPYILYRKQRFLVNNTRFGRTSFLQTTTPGIFYVIGLGIAALTGMAYVVAFIAFIGSVGAVQAGSAEGSGAPGVAVATFVLAFYAIALASKVAYRTATLNVVANATRLGAATLALRLRYGRMLWISLTNVLLIVATLGLFTPVAQVRMRRYLLSQASVTAADADVRRIEAAAEEERSASGDELAGAFDLDVGIA